VGTPPPAGWFTSPDDDLLQRWWDGAAWTSFTRPAGPPADMPTQRTGSPLTTDAVVTQPGPPHTVEETAEALSALQRQGGLVGAFAAVASQALASQLAPSTTSVEPGANGAVVQPYGQPAFENPFAAGGQGGGSRGGVSWRVGPFSGGTDPDGLDDGGTYGRRRRGVPMGPVGQVAFGLVFGLVGLVVALFITNGNTTHADESTATGTVIAHTTHVDDDGKPLCSPVASFTVDGATHRASSNVSTSSCPAIGSAATVIYTTANPGDGGAHIKDTSPTVWFIWLFPLVGLVIVVAGLRGMGTLVRSIRTLLPSRTPAS